MMLWNILSPFVNAALTAIIFWFWKPWAAAYSGEKGKNLARKEDLDAILAEVRAVTITQKDIEAKLTDQVWDRQNRWNQKREIYAELVKQTSDLAAHHQVTANYLTMMSRLSDHNAKRDVAEQLNDVSQKLANAQEALLRVAAVARIFANTHCVDVLDKHYTYDGTLPRPSDPKWMESKANLYHALTANLIRVAKEDLSA